MLRLAGGRAAVFHEGTIGLAHAVPEAPRARDPRSASSPRPGVTRALGGLGVDARVGEVPGEYCPGTYSVSARGERKLAGIGQRLIAGRRPRGRGDRGERRGAGARRAPAGVRGAGPRLGSRPRPARWRRRSPGVTWERVRDALLAEYAREHELVPAELDEQTLDAGADGSRPSTGPRRGRSYGRSRLPASARGLRPAAGLRGRRRSCDPGSLARSVAAGGGSAPSSSRPSSSSARQSSRWPAEDARGRPSRRSRRAARSGPCRCSS